MRVGRLFLWLCLGWAASVPALLVIRAVAEPGEPEPVSPEVMARVDSLVADAYRALKAERYPAAFERFAQVATLDPWESRAYMGMGEAARALNYEELAIEHYRRAVALEPRFYEARKSLTMLLCDFGKHEEALEVLDSMETARPDDSFICGERAVNLVRLGRAKEAIPLLHRYNSLEGRQAWGYENLGRAHAAAGNLEEAEKAYREAITISPRTALAHLWLGQILLRTSRRDEAEGHLRTFRELRTWQTRAYLVEQAVHREPQNIQLLVRLAEARSALGLFQEALIPLERAVQIAPGDEPLKQLLERVRERARAGTAASDR